MIISREEKILALALAKKSIEHYLKTSDYFKMSHNELDGLADDCFLKNNLGCFVTLTIDGHLRGCIGTIISERPLYHEIIKNAVAAAVFDPRFPKVSKDEYSKLHFEISVMGPVTPLPSINDIEIGKHGLIVKLGQNQGLLLPQVPLEWRWNKIEFLEHTCNKAGLPKDAYIDPACDIYYFTADVFSEESIQEP